MHIVQVVQGFPPESLGGTETYAARLAQSLKSGKVEESHISC